MGKVGRYADVDGGFYTSDALDIGYEYWTYVNTPNWLRGKYATPLRLACSERSRTVRTLRTGIDGKKAVIQQCTEIDGGNGARYIYYVTFPRVKVFNGWYFDNGMFNFTVEYRNRRYLPVARDIVRSIDFVR